jgi:hypothetical protein
MARAKKAGERISPTHALEILMTQMTPPAAAKRLTEALHNYDCHIWRNGELVRREDVAHLYVLETCDDADPDRWYATVADDRWDAVPAEYEFDADEISSLLPRQKSRQEPGRKSTGKQHRKLSPVQVEIKRWADNRWPDGHDHIVMRYIIAEARDDKEFRKKFPGLHFPKRDHFLRALGRR